MTDFDDSKDPAPSTWAERVHVLPWPQGLKVADAISSNTLASASALSTGLPIRLVSVRPSPGTGVDVNEVAWADEGEYYPEEEEEATYDDRWGLDQTDTSLDDPQWAGLDLPTYDVAVLDGGMPDFA